MFLAATAAAAKAARWPCQASRLFAALGHAPFSTAQNPARISGGNYLLNRSLTKPLLVPPTAPEVARELAAAFLPVVYEHLPVTLKAAAIDIAPCSGQDARIRYATTGGRSGVLAFMPVEDGAVVRSLEEQYAAEEAKREAAEARQRALRSADAGAALPSPAEQRASSIRERAAAAAGRLARAKAEGRYPPPPALRALHSFVTIDFIDSRSWSSEREDEDEQTARPLTAREMGLRAPLLRTTDFADIPEFASAITRLCGPLVPPAPLLDDLDAWCEVSLDAHIPALRGSRRLRQWLQLMAHSRITPDGHVQLPESLLGEPLFTDLAARAEEAIASGAAAAEQHVDSEGEELDEGEVALADAAAQRRERLTERRQQNNQGRPGSCGRGRSRGGR